MNLMVREEETSDGFSIYEFDLLINQFSDVFNQDSLEDRTGTCIWCFSLYGEA